MGIDFSKLKKHEKYRENSGSNTVKTTINSQNKGMLNNNNTQKSLLATVNRTDNSTMMQRVQARYEANMKQAKAIKNNTSNNTYKVDYSQKMNTNNNGYRSTANKNNITKAPIVTTNTGKASTNKLPTIEELNNKKNSIPKKYEEDKNAKGKEWYKRILQKPELFQDGYNFGDITKTVTGTVADLGLGITKGVTSVGEGVGKAISGGVAQVADWTGHDEYAKKVRNRLAGREDGAFDEKYLPTNLVGSAQKKVDKASVAGEYADKASENIGYMAGMMALNSVAPGSDTAVMFLNSTGHTLAEAYAKDENIEDWQAWTKAIGSGAIETAIEKSSGLLGGKGIGEKMTGKIVNQISSGAGKALSKLLGVASDESIEEFESYLVNYGLDRAIDSVSKLTGNEIEFSEDWNWSEVGEAMGLAFATSFIMGGSNIKNENTSMPNEIIDKSNLSEEQKASLKRVAEKHNMTTEEVQNLINNPPQENLQQTTQNQATELANNEVINNNQQITQSQNKMAENENIEQIQQNQLNYEKSIENFNKNNPDKAININNDTMKQIKLLADKTNNTLEISDEFENDKILAKYEKGKITINGKADSNKALQNIAIHEAIHSKSGTEGFDKLVNQVLTYAKSKDEYETARADLNKIYADKYENMTAKEFDKLMDEEIVTNTLGEYFGSEEKLSEILNNIGQDDRRTFVEKVIDLVKDIINSLTGYKNQQQYFQKIQRQLEHVLSNEEVALGNEKNMIAGKKSLETMTNDKLRKDGMESYKKAQKMVKQGKSNKEIFEATNWFKDKVTGKLKYNFSDKNMEIINHNYKVGQEYTLEQMLKHDILFEIYPQLRNYKVKIENLNINNNNKGKLNGRYNRYTNELSVDINRFDKKSNAEGTLIHEIQHAIQKIEGFSRGTSVKKGMQKYNKNPGEVEAKDTAQRMKLEKYKGIDLSNNLPKSAKINTNLLEKMKIGLYNYLDNISDEVEVNENIQKNQEKMAPDISENNGLVLGGIEKDNQGRTLTKEQQEYFKESKVRDENGNLKTVFHGTPYEFNQFKYDKLGENTSSLGAGFYFTDKQSTAEEYKRDGGNVKEVYLDIKNPISYGKTTITKSEFSKFVNEINNKTNGRLAEDYGDIQYAIDEHDFGGDDIDLISSIKISSGLSWEETYDILRKSIGKDGIISEKGFLNKGENIYVAFNSNQIKNADNTNPTDNPDIRYAYQSNGAWQSFVDKYFKSESKGSTLKQARLPERPVTIEDYNKLLDETKFIPNEDKKALLSEVENVEMNRTTLKDFGEVVKEMEDVYKQIDDEILDTNKTYTTGREETYKKYKKSMTEYDATALEKAKGNIPANHQGRRTKEQWLNIANQIGNEIANKSNNEIEEIAYKTWQDEKPNSKAKLNRQGQSYVEFTSDEWINAVYDSVKDSRIMYGIDTEDNNLENAQNEGSILLPQNPKKNVSMPMKMETFSEMVPQNPVKIRKHYDSIIKSKYTSDEARKIAKEMMGIDTYVPETNEGQLQQADERIKSSSPQAELSSLMSRSMSGGKIDSIDIAVGERLIQYYSKTGNSKKLRDAIHATALAGTSAGQTVQAMSLLNHQTPEGQAIWIERSIEKLNKELAKKKGGTIQTDENGNVKIVDKRGKDITDKVPIYTLTDEMMSTITNSTKENLQENLDKVYEELGQQVPKTLAEQIDSWRYFSMLANFRTHVRNIVGNLTMSKTQAFKNKLSGIIEGVVSKVNPEMERTHTVVSSSKEVKQFAKNDIKNVEDRLGLNDNKYNPKTRLQNNQRTFKSNIAENTLGTAFNLNDKALEAEDGWGLKACYSKALAEYMTANKLTPENITDAQLGKARNYAIEEAKEATFHQENAVASAITQFSKKNKVTKFIVDSALPFVKTPMNVAYTAVEYSPIGLGKTLVKNSIDLRKGNITVNQYIDNISKGLTGSGITFLGYVLAEAGILKASGDDDDKLSKFESDQGKQSYSIQIGDNTYSLDWLAPLGIPLFIGAELHALKNAKLQEKSSISNDDNTMLNQVGKSAGNLFNALATAMNPMTEMSMLSGLTSTLSSYEENKLAGIMTNMSKSYVNQFVPTALGQVAKVTDDYERSTTSTKTGLISKTINQTANQIKAKIPGLRKSLPVKTDIWGDEQKTTEDIYARAFETFIAPYTRKEIKDTALNKALSKLYKDTGEASVLPSSIEKDMTIDKQKYRYTDEEYANAKKEYGKNAKSILTELTTSNNYNKMSDTEKVTAISDVYSYVKEKLKKNYADDNKLELKTSTLYDTVTELKDRKANISSFFQYNAQTKEMKKDIEKVKYLSELNTDSKTKDIIYRDSLMSKVEEGKTTEYEELKEYYANNSVLGSKNYRSYDIIEQYIDYKIKSSNKLEELKTKGSISQGSNKLNDKEATQLLVDSKYTNPQTEALYVNVVASDTNKEKYEIVKQMNGGNKISTYLEYVLADKESDKEDDGTKNGKTIDGTKKKKVVSAIQSTKLNEISKIYLLGTEYDLNTNTELSNYYKLKNYLKTQSESDQLRIVKTLKRKTEMKDGTYNW